MVTILHLWLSVISLTSTGLEEDWPSGGSTYLPPMWTIVQIKAVSGLILLVLYSALGDFSPDTQVFPSHQKLT